MENKGRKLKHGLLILLVLVIAFQLFVSEYYSRTELVIIHQSEVWSRGSIPSIGRGYQNASLGNIKFLGSILRRQSHFSDNQIPSGDRNPPVNRLHQKPCEGNSRKAQEAGVTLRISPKRVVMDNGFLQVTLSIPEGFVTRISFNGVDNLLETRNIQSNRGYYDVAWNAPGYKCSTNRLLGRSFKIKSENESQTEISFTSTWNPARWNSSLENQRVPLNVDIRYVMLRGHVGFYSYAILEHEKGWPAMNLYEIRAVYKLSRDKFHYMAISDDRQGIMPMPQDRKMGKPLAYKEAVILTRPTSPYLKGEVDDKYQYSREGKDDDVHGWISFDPPIGFWLIAASNEFRTGGPLKQDLTCHAGPTTLAMFHSTHYAGKDMAMKFENGEPWKKVLGPFFIHLNSGCSNGDPLVLWEKAKHQLLKEVGKWPYDFPLSRDFPKSHHRGSIEGRLLVEDRYVSESLMPASSAWVGLAPPGKAGSWQKESKGYQFWVQADSEGYFAIKGIRAGNYSLYAWVSGFIGDYKYEHDITITQGCQLEVDDIIFQPPRNGPTLWELGVPDRTAAEFYVPDPKPNLSNRLLRHDRHNKFRQYGLWDRYTDRYPDRDIVYTIGISDYREDWFFAHVPRLIKKKTYQATTWQIVFPLENLKPKANYTLQLALASAAFAELQVWFNQHKSNGRPKFTTKLIGRDNAIARHGIHGLYWLFSVDVRGSWLQRGNNSVYFKQSRNRGPFLGVMYDYIRFEGPPR